MNHDMNDRMDGCKAFWFFLSFMTVLGSGFILWLGGYL